MGVFVDFQGPFDNLEWSVVLERMNQIECGEIDMWMNYFRDRRVCATSENEIVWKDVRRGCPQGSICGPTVWNFMMNDLLNELEESGCDVVAYADDVLMLVEGSSRRELETKGTEWMRMATEWGTRVGVNVSEKKTVGMILKGRLAKSRYPNVRVGGNMLKFVQEVRYLDVTVGERMNFGVHVKGLRDRVANVMGGLRRVMRKEWGLKRRAVRTIYKGLLTACAMYGAVAWSECMQYAYAKRAIAQCERIGLYACTNVCRTVSTEAMEILMGELPWIYEVKKRVCMYQIRKNVRVTGMDGITEEMVNGRTIEECKRTIESKLFDEWQCAWRNSSKGRVTYAWIKDVRCVRNCGWVEPTLAMGYLLTGHGSMNGYLHERSLSETDLCECGKGREDWVHILAECELYEDIRDLDGWGVKFGVDGEIDVSAVMVAGNKYERISKFANEVFMKRRMRAREQMRME